jgi:cell division protein FtsB
MGRILNIKNNIRSESTNSNSSLRVLLNNIFVQIALLVVSVFILASVYNSFNITVQKLEILKQAEKEVEELRIRNLHLSISMKEMSTDKYLEKEARDRLNFGGDEEIVFILPKNALELASKEVENITEEKIVTLYRVDYGLEEWIRFVLAGI